MLNILKKVPIIEIVIILLLNIIIFCMGTAKLLGILLITEGGVSYNEMLLLHRRVICDFFVVGCYIIVYLNIFNLSANRLFIKKVYNLKNCKKKLNLLFIILLFLSPSFWFGLLSRSILAASPGCYLSLAFPLWLLYKYIVLKEKFSKRISQWVNIIAKIVVILLTLGFVGDIFVVFPDVKIAFTDLGILNIGIIFLTAPMLVSKELCFVIDWIKYRILYVLIAAVLLCYLVVFYIKNDWITFYFIYLFVLFCMTIIFSTPILKLKAKNMELRREIENEFENVNND